MPKIINFNVPIQTAGKNREFCVEFDNIYVNHKISDDNQVEAFHDGKKVLAGIDKHVQMQGNPNIIYDNSITNLNETYDIYEEEPSFLLYDSAGTNYIHFFFCFFGRCFYYDELSKIKKIKLYVPEQFFMDEGRANHSKQWLKLYYKNIDIHVLKADLRYKFKNLILSNTFYSFPQPFGYDYITKMIRSVTESISPLYDLPKRGVYISRQDTIKRKWYHNRVLENELELIDNIKSKLDYDIIELMDYDMENKIKIFKSYKNIIQQHSASVIGILFSNPKTKHFLIEHPKMNWWLTPKCKEFAAASNSELITIESFGELILSEKQIDDNNYPWKLNALDFLMENIKNMESK